MVIRIGSKQKRRAYFEEEENKLLRRAKEEGARLAKEFKNRGVDFTKDICPLFVETFARFIDRWAAKKAITEAAGEARKEVKQSQLAVQVLTKADAPFRAETKAALKSQWAAFQQNDLENMFLQTLRREEGADEEIVSPSLDKSWHKHPAWKTFEQQVDERLMAAKVSRRQAYRLIALLYTTFIPDAFKAAHKEDAIRQRLTYAKK